MARSSLTKEVTSLRRPVSHVWLDSSGMPSRPSPLLPDMRRLVEAAILAPSPDNNQPWQFVAGPDYLDVHLDLARSLPSDVNHMFDLTGIGAAVENICIASREQGFEPQVEPLSDDEAFKDKTPRQATGTIPVARVRWSAGAKRDSLYTQIGRRHTIRSSYSTLPIEPVVLAELTAEAQEFPGIQVQWLTSRRDIWRFAWLVGEADRMRFERREFHAELYKQLRFTPEEAQSAGDGLDIRALALPPGGSFVLKLLRNWQLLSFANRLGASRFLALPSVPQVIRSAAVGLCSTEGQGGRYVNSGRAFARLWLRATQYGLAIHPLGSLPICLKRESTHARTNVHQRLDDLVRPKKSTQLQIAFRIGTPA